MLSRFALISLAACLLQPAFAQWADAHKIGQGGESTIASDGKGNVYVTAHGPSQLFKSSDWGASYTLLKQFNDAQCDLCVLPLANGMVQTMYLINGVVGIAGWYSPDFGKTFTPSQSIKGDLDREWIAIDPATQKIYMDYSNGYIGGPKSKGVYFVTSTDHSKTFSQPIRVDREPEGSYAVDPYIARTGSGRIICMWQVSTDYNTIDCYRTAYSDDDGKTFSEPVTVATFDKTVGDKPVDTQERWILGAILAVGKSDIVVVYPGYENVEVDGKAMVCDLEHFRVSHDGGATYEPAQTVLSKEEIQDAVRSFIKNGGENVDYGYYIENLPWLAADATGQVHMVYTDNRDGASAVMAKGKPLASWRVRHAVMKSTDHGFDRSEVVSQSYAAKRPPMDFISCSADSKYVYASWTATPGSALDWNFSGELWTGRKPLK